MDLAQIFSGFAVGTDLRYVAITKSGGTLVHARRGHVDWLGSHRAPRIPKRVLRPALAGMLVLVGGKLIAV